MKSAKRFSLHCNRAALNPQPRKNPCVSLVAYLIQSDWIECSYLVWLFQIWLKCESLMRLEWTQWKINCGNENYSPLGIKINMALTNGRFWGVRGRRRPLRGTIRRLPRERPSRSTWCRNKRRVITRGMVSRVMNGGCSGCVPKSDKKLSKLCMNRSKLPHFCPIVLLAHDLWIFRSECQVLISIGNCLTSHSFNFARIPIRVYWAETKTGDGGIG